MTFRPPAAQSVSIDGPAGALEAVLEAPPGAASFFGVVCHPHPLHGGTLHNKVVHTLARALQQRGVPTLRFNFRGVGASAGQHDDGRGETDDVLSVTAWGRGRWPDAELILAGFSFGAVVALRASAAAQPARLITVAPAVDRVYAGDLVMPRCPWLLVQGEDDEIVATAAVLAFARRQAAAPRTVVVPATGHFFHGRLGVLQEEVQRFLDSVVDSSSANP